MNFDRLKQSVYSNTLSRDAINKDLLQNNNIENVIEYDKIDEKVYYNLKLFNDTEDPIPVRFNVNRVNSIIPNNSQQWELGVENFSIPTYDIPILLTGLDDDDYVITITQVDPGTTHSIIVVFDEYVNENRVYDYESLVLGVNESIAQLCNGDFGLTEYPFIRYNGNGNFDFYFPPLFTADRQDPLNPVGRAYRIDFNFDLLRIFNCFEADIDGTLESSLRQGENLITWNGVNYAVRKSQWDPRPAMIRWTRIIFLSDSIPIRDELLGSETDKMESQLLDYIINNRVLDKTNINYFPNYVKYNNLLNSSDLRRLSVRVMLEYEDGTLYPLDLYPDTNFFMKLVFRKKNNGLSV